MQRYEGLLTFAELRCHLLPRAAVRRSSRRGSGRWRAVALLVERRRRRATACCSSPAWTRSTGAHCRFEANRAFSTYRQPQLPWAPSLIFSVPVALGLALVETTTWPGASSTGPGSALNALALIVSFTRGAWIGAALSLVLVACLRLAASRPAASHRLGPRGRHRCAGIGRRRGAASRAPATS